MNELTASGGRDKYRSNEVHFDLDDISQKLEHIFDGGQGLVLSRFEPPTEGSDVDNCPSYMRMRANVVKEGLLVNDYDVGVLKYDEVGQPVRYLVEVFKPVDDEIRKLWDFCPSADSDQLKHYIYNHQTKEFLLSVEDGADAFAEVIDDMSHLHAEDCKENLASHQMSEFKLSGLKDQRDVRYGIEVDRLSMLQYTHEA